MRALARKSQAKALAHRGQHGRRRAPQRPRALKRLEKQIGRRVFLEGGSALPVDSFRVISEGSLAHVRGAAHARCARARRSRSSSSSASPTARATRSATSTAYMLIVEGGRQHLGKRRKVRVTEIARTGAQGDRAQEGRELTAGQAVWLSFPAVVLREKPMTKPNDTYAIVRCGGQQFKVSAGDIDRRRPRRRRRGQEHHARRRSPCATTSGDLRRRRGQARARSRPRSASTCSARRSRSSPTSPRARSRRRRVIAAGSPS